MISQELREVMEKIESLKPEWKLAQGAILSAEQEFSDLRYKICLEKQIAEASGVEVNVAAFLPELKKSEFKAEAIQSFRAFCELCKKGTMLSFKPDGKRPVYCKDCFIKTRASLPPRTIPPLKKEKRERKNVDTEGLKKILEDVLPKK